MVDITWTINYIFERLKHLGSVEMPKSDFNNRAEELLNLYVTVRKECENAIQPRISA